MPPKEGASYHTKDKTKEQIKDRGIKGEFMHSLNRMNASNAVITGIIQVSSAYAHVLFDLGATQDRKSTRLNSSHVD